MLPLNLPRIASYEEIAFASILAAHEMGLEARLVNVNETKIINGEEVEVPDHIDILVTKVKPRYVWFGHKIGRIETPLFKVANLRKRQSMEHVYVFPGTYPPSATTEECKEYTERILKHIGQSSSSGSS